MQDYLLSHAWPDTEVKVGQDDMTGPNDQLPSLQVSQMLRPRVPCNGEGIGMPDSSIELIGISESSSKQTYFAEQGIITRFHFLKVPRCILMAGKHCIVAL